MHLEGVFGWCLNVLFNLFQNFNFPKFLYGDVTLHPGILPTILSESKVNDRSAGY